MMLASVNDTPVAAPVERSIVRCRTSTSPRRMGSWRIGSGA